MLPNTSPQLTPEQIAQIEEARKIIPQLRKEIQRAKLAGLDMSAQEEALNTTEEQIAKLYRVYVRGLSGSSKT